MPAPRPDATIDITARDLAATSCTMKVVITGDVNGSLNALFKRVAAVNKSNGPFDMLFCVGCFFPIAGAYVAAAN